jgi:hypothetical protein
MEGGKLTLEAGNIVMDVSIPATGHQLVWLADSGYKKDCFPIRDFRDPQLATNYSYAKSAHWKPGCPKPFFYESPRHLMTP